jgi:hypothetical protein
MLKMLATLLPIDEGQASVFGVDVRRDPHVVRQLLGVTGQCASVDELLTATENLVLFGRLQGLARADARRTAERLLEGDAAGCQAKLSPSCDGFPGHPGIPSAVTCICRRHPAEAADSGH